MIARRAGAVFAVLLLSLWQPAKAQSRDIDQILDDIVATYESIQGARARLVLESDPQIWEEVAVHADGRFLIRQYDERSEPPSVTFSSVDGEYLYVDSVAGYTKTPLARLPDVRIWWAGQLGAPWPMVPTWIRQIQRSQDADIHTSDNSLVIGSPSLELQLWFNLDHFALEQIVTSSTTTFVFEDFDWSVAPPLPRRRVLLVQMPEEVPGSPGTIRSEMAYLERDINPDAIEVLVQFDPAAIHADRYDPESGNVLDEAGKVKYNHDEKTRAMLEHARKQASGEADNGTGRPENPWATWLIGGGMAGAAITLILWILAKRK